MSQRTPTQLSLKWGAILGVLGMISTAANYLLEAYRDNTIATISLVVGIILSTLVFVLAMKAARQNNDGYLTFGEGFEVGALVAAISGLLIAAFNGIYLRFIVPATVVKLEQFQRQLALSKGMTAQQYEKSITSAAGQLSTSVGFLFILKFFVVLILGIIISLIVAAFVRKEKSIFE
jgi:uncharacterized integral membrane protein